MMIELYVRSLGFRVVGPYEVADNPDDAGNSTRRVAVRVGPRVLLLDGKCSSSGPLLL